MLQYHKAIDGYKYFERYTNCKHKERNEIECYCQACDTTWLIGRCEILEKIIEEIIGRIGMKYYTTPEEQFYCWFDHYLNMRKMDEDIFELSDYEEVNPIELWLCVVAQELL